MACADLAAIVPRYGAQRQCRAEIACRSAALRAAPRCLHLSRLRSIIVALVFEAAPSHGVEKNHHALSRERVNMRREVTAIAS